MARTLTTARRSYVLRHTMLFALGLDSRAPRPRVGDAVESRRARRHGTQRLTGRIVSIAGDVVQVAWDGLDCATHERMRDYGRSWSRI